ncbi:hypothetical protein HMPREF1863_00453, partial [Aedoeadaptatus coxii]
RTSGDAADSSGSTGKATENTAGHSAEKTGRISPNGRRIRSALYDAGIVIEYGSQLYSQKETLI